MEVMPLESLQPLVLQFSISVNVEHKHFWGRTDAM